MTRAKAGGLGAIPTGIAHGTVTVISPDGPVEVTTLRHDLATDGRHAVVEFTDDWQADAARRDFTINALYVSIGQQRVFDYFDGQADLTVPRVRFIGDPLRRIAEDHLRIMRFFRFHARFGRGEPEREGYAACCARANDLMALSRERIASELLKLLAVADPAPTLVTMIAGGIFTPIIPAFRPVDVTRLEALLRDEREAGVEASAIRRLAALIGPRGALARDLAARLRLSTAQAKRLELACGPAGGGAQALAYRIGAEGAVDRLLLAGEPGLAAGLAQFVAPVLPIKGADLLARGVTGGPLVGQLLREIDARWIAAGFNAGAAFDTLVDAVLREHGVA